MTSWCKIRFRIIAVLSLFIATFNPTTSFAQVFVDINNPGPTHDGLSWATAYLTIGEAIADSRSANQPIWVAGGKYQENLTLSDGRKIYGSFNAGDTALSDRDLVKLSSIITGVGDSPRRPITAIGVTNTTVNGFYISNGLGGGTGLDTQGGGVLYFMADNTNRLELCDIVDNGTIGDGGGVAIMDNSSPIISNCEFFINSAEDDGGAIYITNFSNPQIAACFFQLNSASDRGGNIYVSNNSAPTISFCQINEGTAMEGGGAFFRDNSNATLIEAIFSSNVARLYGGGVGVSDNSAPIFTECEFRNNVVEPAPVPPADQNDLNLAGFLGLPSLLGGGAYVDASNPTFNDCEFFDNEAAYGGGVGVWNASPVINNSRFRENGASSIGGGVFVAGPSGQAQFSDCEFSQNSAFVAAAGAFVDGAVSPVFSGCDFTLHSAGVSVINTDTGATPLFEDSRFFNNALRAATLAGNSTPRFERCLISNNTGGAVLASGNLETTPVLTNCIISRNNSATGGAVRVIESFLDLMNCTLDQNTSAGESAAVHLEGETRARLINTAITNTAGIGVHVAGGGAEVELDSCQFWSNSGVDYANNIEGLFLSGGHTINTQAPDARDNITGPPRYRMNEPAGFTGTFDASEFDDGSITTIFTDNEANFPPGGLVGRLMEIPNSGVNLHIVVANSSTAIAISGSYTDTPLPASYRVLDFSLVLQSAGVDRGRSAGAPADDFNQLPRPVDTIGLGVPGRSMDVGAHELQTTSVPGGAPDVVYVDWAARGLDNGTSWIDAYNSLHDAVADPASATKEIWIANGVYGPFIQIPSGRRIIGGFRTGDVTKADRDLLDSKAILQPYYILVALGKSPGSDEPSVELLPPDNMTSPVVALLNTTGVILDGLIIADGSNESTTSARVGGLYMEDCDASNIIRNCEIRNNQALDGDAHGVLLESSSPRFERTIIENNQNGLSAMAWAGGLNAQHGSSPTFVDCNIRQNVGEAVGGMIFDVDCHPVLTNTRIHTNAATNGSGSTYGGMWVVNSSTATLTDCLIGDNSAQGVGGYGQSGGFAQMTRCVITGNLGNATGGMKLSSGNELGSMIRDSIISGNISNLIGGIRLTDDSTLINCVVGGNIGTNGIIETSDSGDQVFQNCTISRNHVFQHDEGIFRAGAGSNLRLVNSIIEGNIGIGIQELSPGVAVDLINNLFHDNDQDYKDLVGTDTFFYNGATEMNTMIDGGTQLGNVAGPARFVMVETPLEGTLTAATVEVNQFASRLTDDNADFIPGELKGRHVIIPQDESRHLYILDNTKTTIDYLKVGGVGPNLASVKNGAGDMAGDPQIASIPAVGQRYLIIDHRLTKYSAAVDRGAVAGAPNADIAGLPRPVDTANIGASGADTFDIGAHEFQETSLPVPPGVVVYVDLNATGVNDGSSWLDAHDTIQAAINNPDSATKPIWVAKGIYSEKITLANNRKLFANFQSGDLTLDDRDARHPYTKQYDDPYFQPLEPNESAPSSAPSEAPFSTEDATVIFGDEQATPAPRTMVTLNNVTDTLLDGFIIAGGFANATVGTNSRGGGINATNANNTNIFRNLFIVANGAGASGGGVYLNQASSPQMERVVLMENQAPSGAGLYCESSSSPAVANSYFRGNQGDFGGGVACIDNSSPTFTNTTFFQNRAANLGSGIYAESGSALAISTCLFDNNLIRGGIAADNATITLINTRLQRNVSNFGGALLLTNGATGSATECIIIDNSALDNGAGVAINASNFSFSRTAFLNNTASDNGGGVWSIGGSGNFDRCRFANNTAQYGGGAYLESNSNLTFLNTLVFANRSHSQGAGMYLDASSPMIRHVTFSRNLTFTGGAGIHLLNGSSPTITSSIFADNFYLGIREHDATSDPVLTFNLFHNNSDGDYYDEGTTNYTNADDINANIAEASDNVDGDPAYAMDGPYALTGIWTDDRQNTEVPHFTLLTDDNADFTTGGLVGRLIQTNISNNDSVYYIFANTSTLIAVHGNASGNMGDNYRILDHQLSSGSSALDRATAAGAPAGDLRGNPRPVDITGVGFNGTGQGFDIGAFEWQPPVISLPYSTLNVGEQFIGGRTNLTLPITNAGATPLEFESFGLSFIGGNAGDFFFDPNPPDKSTILPGETREIDYAFSPQGLGARTTVLTIITSDPNTPQTGIILNGVGLERLDSWIIH